MLNIIFSPINFPQYFFSTLDIQVLCSFLCGGEKRELLGSWDLPLREARTPRQGLKSSWTISLPVLKALVDSSVQVDSDW